MSGPTTHWASRPWRDSLDELAADPSRPQAVPASVPTDLMGRIRVRLCAEEGGLVAYGFGGQRIVLPAASVGAVRTVDAYRVRRVNCGRGLLVLDHQDRILLRAGGLWETYGDVAAVCRAARVPKPSHVSYSPISRSATATAGGRGRGRKNATGTKRKRQPPPRYERAPGAVRLRRVPRGNAVRVLARIISFLCLVGLAAFVGVLPAVLLPSWFGTVCVLLGIAGAVLGALAGIWLFGVIAHAVTDTLRWAIASRAARTVAPPDRFFGRRRTPVAWSGVATLGMVALVPALIAWGPGVGTASLVHGLRDSSTVARLRAHGVSTRGLLIDVPRYSADDDGDTTVTDVATLTFFTGRPVPKNIWETDDPAIGGRPLALDRADPAGTRRSLTVVYLPGDPDTAAARQQIEGSVWHGAPTANIVVGSLFTLALPLLIGRVAVRIRRRKWTRDGVSLDDLGPR